MECFEEFSGGNVKEIQDTLLKHHKEGGTSHCNYFTVEACYAIANKGVSDSLADRYDNNSLFSTMFSLIYFYK